MTTQDENTHGAGGSATGYLYQCRYALLAAIRAISDSPKLAVSIERFDDVAFEVDGTAVERIQTKHHRGAARKLTDTSTDLWKTLYIWSKVIMSDGDAAFRTRFLLLTTATAPGTSAASLLRPGQRDEVEADNRLMKAVATSRSVANKKSYAAYKSLSEVQRRNLLRAITVLDGSPSISDVHDEICREVRYAVPAEHVQHFVERLEGWWFGVVIRALMQDEPSSISVTTVDARIDELREDFHRSALPLDFEGATPPQNVVADLDARPFVRQLRLIKVGATRIEFAIRDYYRAAEQRSKWAREELLVDGELARYERSLVEEWEPRFAAMADEMDPGADVSARVAAGQCLFKWAETEANIPLRTIRARFLTHGSYHILSNKFAIGWHPDYRVELRNTEEA